ncbi:MAG: ADP-ribosylation factor-like protein [Promethearchaeota archaeon]
MALREFEIQEIQEELNWKQIDKISILGLANAGKTCIIKSILYEFEGLMAVTPTKGVNRTSIEFLGRELVIWDYGGQDKYKKDYLLNPGKYFSAMKYVYYVVDCQDPWSLQESEEYFLQTLQFCHAYSPSAKILLFFHKVDPKYDGKVDFTQVENDFLAAVLPKYQELKKEPLNIYHTSIYDPFTVISGFSQPLLDNKDIYNTLSQTMNQFCDDNNFDMGFLFTKNLFEIGHYFKPQMSKVVNSALKSFIIDYDLVGFSGKFPEMSFGFSKVLINKFIIYVGENPFPFYLCIGVDTGASKNIVEKDRETIDIFILSLKTILRNSELIRLGVLRTNLIKPEETQEK